MCGGEARSTGGFQPGLTSGPFRRPPGLQIRLWAPDPQPGSLVHLWAFVPPRAALDSNEGVLDATRGNQIFNATSPVSVVNSQNHGSTFLRFGFGESYLGLLTTCVQNLIFLYSV